MRARHLIVVALLAVFAAAGGYLTARFLASGPESGLADLQPLDPSGTSLLGQQRPDFKLGLTDGAWASATDFDGKVVLYNFWATWCKPCREEMPMLSTLRESLKDRGFEVVGIAIDDVDRARQFIGELGISYPVVVGSTDVMSMLADYGNAAGMLPYSVLVDRGGTVRWAHFGAIEERELKSEVDAQLTKP